MTKNLKELSLFFAITNAAFAIADAFRDKNGQDPLPQDMRDLHRKALKELQKDEPNLLRIDALIAGMDAKAEPSNYNIAIREDGKLFRIPKDLDYCDKISKDRFSIQYGDRKCALRQKYFDMHGRLREQYWALDRIL